MSKQEEIEYINEVIVQVIEAVEEGRAEIVGSVGQRHVHLKEPGKCSICAYNSQKENK